MTEPVQTQRPWWFRVALWLKYHPIPYPTLRVAYWHWPLQRWAIKTIDRHEAERYAEAKLK